jgi:hypothetical protein
MTGFAVEVFQNEYLPEGGRDVSAIVTVTSADDDLAPEDDPGGAEIIMIDCSGSMAGRGKIAAARQAAAVAIDAIRDRKRELEVLEALIKVGITSPTDLLPPAPCQNVDASSP